MPRPLSRRLLTLALASALAVPAWAQSAFAPFTVSDIRIVETLESSPDGVLHRGIVDVTSQVVSFQRRLPNGRTLGEEALDLPPQELRTQAVWSPLPPW